MDLADKAELRRAIDDIRAVANLPRDVEAEEAFLRAPDIGNVYYEKIADAKSALVPLVRVLLIAESFIRQPNVKLFYDIFRAARYVAFVRAIGEILPILRSRTTGWEPRFRKLVGAPTYDSFESTLFELLTGARYAELRYVKFVEFLVETPPVKSPDLRVELEFGPVFVECKKFDRQADVSARVRDRVREITRGILHSFDKRRESVVVEIEFSKDPEGISPGVLTGAAEDALRLGGTIISPGFHLRANRTIPLDLRANFKLMPSPDFYMTQFGFSTEGPWHGLVEAFRGKMAGPSWVDRIDWVCGVKWKLSDDAILWKETKLNFDLLFDGLEQLAAFGERTILHACYDRHTKTGHRARVLQAFLDKLRRSNSRYSWLIFNELDINVTTNGRFDFREHAHPANGPSKFFCEAPVKNVFISHGEFAEGPRESFGVGVDLPPLD